ncbi:MAG: hypothetical protein JW891_02445 [Candidatus Lokiarchaeota archaeon]|nr:hypothetical protein [Candidatus Lokiarchaeota archaeon]
MTKKAIAVDIVGVLLDAIERFIEEFNEVYKTNRKKSDITRWDFYLDWDLSEREFFNLFYTAYEKMMEIPFIDDNAPEYLKRIHGKSDVSILSAGQPRFRSDLVKKLRFHEIKEGIHYKDFIIVKERPWDLKLAYDFDIYIDDNPNLVEPIKIMKEKYLLLYDQPWNKESSCEGNVIRVRDWKEICTTLNNIT